MQDQALLESVSEIVTLAGDGINAALADLNAQSEESDYSEALEACQGGVETIAMAAEMAELERLQQICGALTEHFGSLNGHASEFLRNHGSTLAGWSGTVLAYIQTPTDTTSETLDEALLAPLPDELRTRFIPQAEAGNDRFAEAADQITAQSAEADSSIIKPVSVSEDNTSDQHDTAADLDAEQEEASALHSADNFADVDTAITEHNVSEFETATAGNAVEEYAEAAELAPDLLSEQSSELALASDVTAELDSALAADFDADDLFSEQAEPADERPVDTDSSVLETTDTESESGAEVFIGKFIDDSAGNSVESPIQHLIEESDPVTAEPGPANNVFVDDVLARDTEDTPSAMLSAVAETSAAEDDVNDADDDLHSEIEEAAASVSTLNDAEEYSNTRFETATDEPRDVLADNFLDDEDDDEMLGALQEQLAATFDEFEPFRQQLIGANETAALDAASNAYIEVIERVQIAAEAVGLNGFAIAGELLSANVQMLPGMEQPERAAVAEVLAEWPVAVQAYFNDPAEQATQMTLVELLTQPGWLLPLPEDQIDDMLVALAPDPDDYLADVEQRPTVAQPDDVVLAIGADVNPKLVTVFMHESPLNAAEFSATIERIVRGDDIVRNLANAQRLAHNIKGSANMIGVKGIANMTHHVEDILEYLTEHQRAPQPDLARTLQEAADCVEAMLESLQSGTEAPADAQRILQNVFDWANRMDAGQLEAPVEPSPAPGAADVAQRVSAGAAPAAALPEPAAATLAPQTSESTSVAAQEPATASVAEVAAGKMVRVPTDTIDAMFRMVGEVSVALDQLQDRFAAVRRHSNDVQQQHNMVQQRRFELENFIDVRHVANTQQRLRQLSQDKDFDPLEMDQYDELYSTTRSFIESVVDSQRMSQQMRAELSSLERSLAPLQHMKDELQAAVMKTRMEPVNTIVARLQRSVRQAARATDKQVDLFIKGSEIQIDSEVLERLADPLMHMLRNAVDHGIELPADRTAKGKPATGMIRLSFFQEGQNVVVECRDDGRGLDYERIRTTAIARGLLASGATMSNPELARLILAPGFSTRTSATQLSGRGVGMDVVQTTIRELKGIMEIGDAETGGCQISLRLPITLLTSHALVVQVAAERYAIPTSSIMQVLSPRLGRYTLVGDQLAYEIGQDAYPATTLGACLGYAEEGGLPAPECSTVMIYSDAGPVAVAVDNLLKSYDLVVKNLGRYVGNIRGVAGLSTLADGSLIPVLDVAELLRAPAQAFTGATAGSTADMQQPAAARILIVDDSISVRQTLTDLVEEVGYEALLARDGIEAVDLLRKQKPDLVLSDIEMPRMNGLELLSYIRTSHSADLPVIMITSRTMQKHRQQAAEAGANGYVTKPFDEDELLASIRSFMQ